MKLPKSMVECKWSPNKVLFLAMLTLSLMSGNLRTKNLLNLEILGDQLNGSKENGQMAAANGLNRIWKHFNMK